MSCLCREEERRGSDGRDIFASPPRSPVDWPVEGTGDRRGERRAVPVVVGYTEPIVLTLVMQYPKLKKGERKVCVYVLDHERLPLPRRNRTL